MVALVRVSLSAPVPVVMLPVITDLELLLAPVTVKESAPSAESLLTPRVRSPVSVDALVIEASSAPLPVLTAPVMLEASRLRESLPSELSLLAPRVTAPAMVAPRLRVTESAAEPVLTAPRMSPPLESMVSMPLPPV